MDVIYVGPPPRVGFLPRDYDGRWRLPGVVLDAKGDRLLLLTMHRGKRLPSSLRCSFT